MESRHDDIMRARYFSKQQIDAATQKQTEDLYKQMGQMTYLAMEGIMGFLSQLGSQRSGRSGNNDEISAKINEAVAAQAALQQRISDLEGQVQFLSRGLERVERFLLSHVQEQQSPAPATQPIGRFQTISTQESESKTRSARMSQDEVKTLCFQARLRLENEGYGNATTSEIVRAAGIKYHQFSYVFKNREQFEQAFHQWRSDSGVA